MKVGCSKRRRKRGGQAAIVIGSRRRVLDGHWSGRGGHASKYWGRSNRDGPYY